MQIVVILNCLGSNHKKTKSVQTQSLFLVSMIRSCLNQEDVALTDGRAICICLSVLGKCSEPRPLRCNVICLLFPYFALLLQGALITLIIERGEMLLKLTW